MPELRGYLPEDFDLLWELDQRCFPADIAYSRRELAYYLHTTTAICLVAWNAEGVSGFVLGNRGPRGVGHIITLDIDERDRRAGLGSVLMQAIEDRFRVDGCTSVLLEVAVNNLSALTFYKKHGYSVLKTLRRYYPGNLDGLLMGKPIAS